MYFLCKYDDQTFVGMSNFIRYRSKRSVARRSVDNTTTPYMDHEVRPSESGFGNDFAPSVSGNDNEVFNREQTDSSGMFGRAVVTNRASPRERERRLKADDSHLPRSDENDNNMPFGIDTDDIYNNRRKSGHRGSYVEQTNPVFHKKSDNL